MKPVKDLSRIAWSKCLLQTLALGAFILMTAAQARAVTFTWTTNTYLSGSTDFMTLATGWSKLASFSIGGPEVTFGGETWSDGGSGNWWNPPQNSSGPNGFGFDWSRPNVAWGSAYNGFDPVGNNIVNKQAGYANPDTGPYCRIKITGFVPGQEYQVQFIVADTRAAQYGRSVTIRPVSLDGNTLLGGDSTAVQYSYNNGNNDATFAVVTADFVADASTYGFVPWCLDSSSSPTGPQINAIRITTPPAAPILVAWDNGSGSGAWNTSDTNWTGYVWDNSLPNTANFTSLPGTTNINLSQNITARDVTWGNLTGSLTNVQTLTVTNNFNVQGNTANYFPYTNNPTFTLDGPTLNVAGNLGIGRMTLLVGNSAINAKLITSAAVNGAVGDLIISSGAIVRATNGIDYSVNDTSASSGLELNGGTLYVPSIKACDDQTHYTYPSTMKWNGGTLVPTADNANFITVYSQNNGAATDTFVENGGAVIDTAGHNIGIGVNLRGEGTGGLTKNGNGTLTLSGANNDYTGPTVLNAGTLALGATGSISNSANISLAAGATLDVSAVSFALGGSQTLANSGTGTATITGNLDASVGTVALSFAAGTPSFTVNNTLTLSSGTTFTVNNTGAQLANGSYKLIATTGGGIVAGTLPAVTVTGNGAASPATLYISGGELYLLIDNLPVASSFTLGAVSGVPATVKIIGGKHTPTDTDGDTLTVTTVSTPANGTATTDGTSITYTAGSTFTGTDSFTYTVSDGLGGTDTATITVTVAADGEGFNKISAKTDGGNDVLAYAGVPGLNYALDFTTSLNAPVTWTPVVTNTADATTGLLNFTNATPVGNHFYRTRYVAP